MALQWEPIWDDVVVEKWGVRLRVKKDRVTGVYACPVCGVGENATYFFTLEDLLRHLLSHGRREKAETIHVVLHEEGESAKLEEVGEEE